MSKVNDKEPVNLSKDIASLGEATLKEILSLHGLNPAQTERAIKDYKRYKNSDISNLSILTEAEVKQIVDKQLVEELIERRRKGGIGEEALKSYFGYLDYKKDIAETYQGSKDWVKVFSTSVYSDVGEAQEAFIDYVEETYQTKVKDAKQLQELTGITHINSYYDKGKTIELTSEDEQMKRALVELEDTLVNARYNKYFRALETALQEGAKYKDLFQINPQDYGLPESWSGRLGSDQYSSILYAISFEFLIDEPASLMMLPDLRSIAQEIEAPYSVLMDCYRLFNK